MTLFDVQTMDDWMSHILSQTKAEKNDFTEMNGLK